MKKVINILLAICIVAMVYIVYGSIMGPIKFANEKGIRDRAVIQKLMDIKAAQTEYNYQHGHTATTLIHLPHSSEPVSFLLQRE